MSLFRDCDYWAKLDDERPTFVIDGLIDSDATIISGRPMSGKTTLAAGIVAAVAGGEREFLGRKVNVHGPVAVVCTDPGEARKWGRRMRGYGCPFRVFVTDWHPGAWDALISELAAIRPALFVFDNILGALEGNVIANDVADKVIHQLNRVIALGVPVVALHHSSAKQFESGEYAKGPMGATRYDAWDRQTVHVEKTGPGSVLLSVDGNYCESQSIRLDVQVEGESLTARFAVVSDGVRVDRRSRTIETKQRRQTLFDEVAGNPAYVDTTTKVEVGRLLYTSNPGRWPSEHAARVAFDRAAKGVNGVYVQGQGWTPAEVA